MWHDTAIGRLAQISVEAVRAEIIATSRRCDGNMVAIAHELGIHRRWLYRLVYRYDLWHEIEEHRRTPREPEVEPEHWLKATLAVLEAAKKDAKRRAALAKLDLRSQTGTRNTRLLHRK